MTRSELLAFIGRDRALVASARTRYWDTTTPLQRLAVAEALRRHATALRPDWPSSALRGADLETHRRVIDALRGVKLAGNR